jgi:hypothetical protein
LSNIAGFENFENDLIRAFWTGEFQCHLFAPALDKAQHCVETILLVAQQGSRFPLQIVAHSRHFPLQMTHSTEYPSSEKIVQGCRNGIMFLPLNAPQSCMTRATLFTLISPIFQKLSGAITIEK